MWLQFSFPPDHSGQKKVSDLLTYPFALTKSNINACQLSLVLNTPRPVVDHIMFSMCHTIAENLKNLNVINKILYLILEFSIEMGVKNSCIEAHFGA